MAYHNHLSQDLPLHHFTDQSQQQQQQKQSLADSSLRTILPDQLTITHSSSPDPTSNNSEPHHQHHPHHPLQTARNWLNNALLRTTTHTPHFGTTTTDNTNNNNSNFLNLHTASDSTASQASNQWLSRPMLQRNHSDVIDDVAAAAAAGESMIAGTLSHDSGELKNGNGGENLNKSEGGGVVVESGGEGVINWQNARCKAEILAHPLYDQLLSAHVACLRIAMPVDQLPRIDARLAQSQNVVAGILLKTN